MLCVGAKNLCPPWRAAARGEILRRSDLLRMTASRIAAATTVRAAPSKAGILYNRNGGAGHESAPENEAAGGLTRSDVGTP
jgi:hypothetical protein